MRSASIFVKQTIACKFARFRFFLQGNIFTATVYFNLLGILTIDNAFKLKVAIFTFKMINDQICHVFANSISTASSRHSYNTRFSSRQNFSRPKIRTNYGKHTFQFAASQIWETIDCNIKQSNSASSFKTKYRKKLLINQK